MENYLYFAEDPVETGGARVGCDPEAALLPASSYLGCDPGAGTTSFKFMSANAFPNTTTITLTHTAGKNKLVIEAMMKIMNSFPHSTGFIVVADDEETSGKLPEYHILFKGLGVSGCAITDSLGCGGG